MLVRWHPRCPSTSASQHRLGNTLMSRFSDFSCSSASARLTSDISLSATGNFPTTRNVIPVGTARLTSEHRSVYRPSWVQRRGCAIMGIREGTQCAHQHQAPTYPRNQSGARRGFVESSAPTRSQQRPDNHLPNQAQTRPAASCKRKGNTNTRKNWTISIPGKSVSADGNHQCDRGHECA